MKAGDMRFLGLLSRGASQQVLAHTANALILLGMEPGLRGLLGYDELAGRGVLMRAPPPEVEGNPGAPGPYPRPWQDEDVQLILSYLQRMWSSGFKLNVVQGALAVVARQNAYHPIRDYLAGLKWDGTPRLDKWLHSTFKTPDEPYSRAVGSKFLIAAVRRVRHPGCKCDHMPIFEGDQGLGKSKAIAALFGSDFFTDSLPHDVGSRDAAMALTGVWAAELPEIDQIIRTEVETMKAFLSRSKDRYRVPYGRSFIEVLRQCVICGTSNRADYLRDTSGNRRFWPIECRVADVDWVIANRDQLWAEAAKREAAGESIWLDDDAIAEAAVAMQQSRLTEDTWQETLEEWLIGRVEVTTADVLYLGLSISRERQDRRAVLRASDILRKLGWERAVFGRSNDSKRIWRRTKGK